ncbi:unnamed protein product [Chilo suppressalis]|uniref:Cytochrome c oxidase polypeptide VIIc n=1 Tax=Chilo suppressalis TaxID=168631 RepID=A0ABN8B2X4_CHISP|nr:hypothetical protein evm_015288 [Chilo suppressalis]RVE50486.1 hypothetical protein evm_004815 [Chilo suppressalis]CAH0402229.1 unnamed protein product [Chilo suppressalis]
MLRLGIRSMITTIVRSRGLLTKLPTPMRMQKLNSHHDGPTQPFDNMPFKVTNRYLTTIIFAFMFGSGLWAPFFIVWYQMAKKTL